MFHDIIYMEICERKQEIQCATWNLTRFGCSQIPRFNVYAYKRRKRCKTRDSNDEICR